MGWSESLHHVIGRTGTTCATTQPVSTANQTDRQTDMPLIGLKAISHLSPPPPPPPPHTPIYLLHSFATSTLPDFKHPRLVGKVVRLTVQLIACTTQYITLYSGERVGNRVLRRDDRIQLHSFFLAYKSSGLMYIQRVQFSLNFGSFFRHTHTEHITTSFKLKQLQN